MCTGGMPPTPQAVQIAGQKQNQQQYDPSKGPPVQNAASLHTPPPQLPSRLPQGALPMAGLPMTLSQQTQLVENTAQPGGQLQAQVKVQAGGSVLATVNPHTQLQAQLQQQMQPGLHLQLQPQQQQQSQVMLQPGQAVSPPETIKTDFLFVCEQILRICSSSFTDGGTRSPRHRVKPASSENHDQLDIHDIHVSCSQHCSQLSSNPTYCKSTPPYRRQHQPEQPVQTDWNQWHICSQSQWLRSKWNHAVLTGGFSG